MNLIVNADDFGYSHERNVGILECFKSGSVSNTTLLVNGVAAQEAAKMSREHGIPVGLHLNLTEGTPVYCHHKTLVASDGNFLGKTGLREALINGQIDECEVIKEIEAQLEKFKDLTGSLPRHVDGHQHIHIVPNICSIFANTLKKHGVKTTRLPLDYDISVNSYKCSEFLSKVVQQATDADIIFSHFSLRRTNHFFGMTLMGSDSSSEKAIEILSAMFSEKLEKSKLTSAYKGTEDAVVTCEWMVHPGYITGEYGGCGDGPDPFSRSPGRQHEMSILCNPVLRDFFRENKIAIVTYNEI